MARKSTSDRFEEAMKRANGGSNTTKGYTSSTTKKSKEDRFDEAMKNAKSNQLRDSIGLDTFDSDLRGMNDVINKVYSGWQTSDYMASTKRDVSSMYDRLKNYRKYVNSTSTGDLRDFNMQMDDLLSGYSSALSDWDNLTSNYSGYKDADSYTKETTKLKELYSMTTEELKEKLDSEKSPYAYTTYGGQDITWESLYKEKLHADMATSKEGAEGWEKYLADMEAEKEAKKNRSWLDTLVANTPIYDTTTPGGMFSQVVHDKRKDTSYKEPTEEWTDEERNIFGAYYLTDTAKAYEYATSVNNAKNLAKEKAQKEGITDSATSGFLAGTGHTALSLMAAPFGLADYLDDLTSFAAGRPIMSDGFVSPFEYSQTVQSGISADLNDKGGTLNENIPIIGGKGWGDVYGLGTSIAQSALSKPMGTAGVLMSYFGQGAASGVDDALERGATDGQALLYGSSLGALEGALEAAVNIKFKNLGAASTAKVLGSKMLEQGANEAAEEGLTTAFGQVIDAIVMRDKSAFNNAVRTYEANGETKSKAITKALLDVGGDIIYDALGGFVSGGVQAGPSVLYNTSQLGSTVRENNNIEELGNLASELNSDGFKKYTDAIEKGNISNLQLGSLYESVSNETRSKADKATADSIIRTVADRAIELGDSKNSGIIASAIQKNMQGQKLSAEEKTALKSETAQTIMEEIKNDGLDIKISDEMKNASKLYERAEAVYTTKDATKGKKIGNQTVDNESGAEINIEGMSLDEEGNMVLETSEGTRSVNDITVTYEDAQMLDIAKEYEADVKGKGDLFASLYDGKSDFRAYKASFDMMYESGELGIGDKNILEHMGVLNSNQALEIYKVGMKNSTVLQQKKVDAVVENYRKENPDFTPGKFDDSKVNYKNLTKTQKSYVAFVRDFFTKFTGVNVVMYESYLDEKGNRVMKNDDGTVKSAPNGWYDPSTNAIYLDAHAGIDERNKAFESGLITTLSHETTHWMKEKSPTAYKNLTNAVMNALAEARGISIEHLIANERGRLEGRDGKEHSNDDAIDELVARACEDMLGNSEKVHDYLSRMDAETRQTFVEKVRGIIQKLKKWMSELLGAYKSNSKEAEAIRGMAEYLDNIEQLWSEAFMQAVDANQALQSEFNTAEEINDALGEIGLEYDEESETVYHSYRSLEEAFDFDDAEGYLRAREEYVKALMKATGRSKKDANRYLDSLFLVHDLIGNDRARLDYEAAVGRSAWVSNAEYGGSIDFSTLCAKRRLFTGTFDAIQEALPNTVLNENDFLKIRNMLLELGLESPCSMCYVEGSRAKHGEYVKKWLDEYLKTDPEWRPRVADFTSTRMLEKTRINHPEAYKAYVEAMNKLSQRKPKEASVRTDYKGEILVAFADGSSVEIKNKNGGIRFNSFSDFEIIHALDCMQVITDMARVGLAGQAYTKVADFARCFGNTGLKINLSLVAKGVDENGKLIFDEVNGMKYSEAMALRNQFSKNVGTVIVAFNDEQIKAALADDTIDYVLPFHRSQWKKSQYALMGLPTKTKDYTSIQNDRIRNPKTGRPVKLAKIKHINTYTNDVTGETFTIKDNIMPNQYWDYSKSGRENANRYLDYINANGMTPKFDFLLEKADGKWVLPKGAVGDGYFKVLIDFKMYDNNGIGSPQNPVLPEFNMDHINEMLEDYKGGHESFPIAHNVVDKFVDEYKKEHPKKQYSDRAVMTTERIDDLIEDSGAGMRADYARKWITSINPTDFINLTTKIIQNREVFDKTPGEFGSTMETWDYLGQLKKSKRQTPYLAIDVKTGQVVGHEGRHRMRALEQNGVTSAEIVIEFRKDGYLVKELNGYGNPLETIESMLITNQEGTKQSATIKNIIPLNKAHRDEIISSYGENTGESFIQYSDRERLNDSQKKNYDYNQKQTEVGTSLKTLNGSVIKRYQNNVGKEVGGQVYFHRDYAEDIIPYEMYQKALTILEEKHPGFEFNTLVYDKKNGTIRFDEAPDFDTAREPIAGNYVTVNVDDETTSSGYSDYIWHHKWEWVKNDYTGFDVAKSWNWSKQWLSVLRATEDKVSNRGIANGSGHGTKNWNEQLKYFGLPVDGKSNIQYSLRNVEPFKPTSDKWQSGHSEKWFIENGFPVRKDVSSEWLEARIAKGWTEGKKSYKEKGFEGVSKKVGTQISSTESTYEKIYNYLESEYPNGEWKKLRILDASSGLGMGTRLGLERGFNVTDIEPYVHPDSDYFPDYMDYSSLQDKVESGEVEPFDFIISNAVLNVIPQDSRDNMVSWFASVLAEGGRLYVNTLDANYTKNAEEEINYDKKGNIVGQVLTQKGSIDDETGKSLQGNEVFVGASQSVQKGFTNVELREYLQDALGRDNFKVDAPNFKAGSGATALAIKHSDGVQMSDRDSDYLNAVNRGDMETAQKMVDEVAKANGYNSPKLYHGTPLETTSASRLNSELTDDEYAELDEKYDDKIFPFVVFNTDRNQSGLTYTATNKKVAKGFTYRFTSKRGTVYGMYGKFKNPLVVDEHIYDSVPYYYAIPTPSAMKETGVTESHLSTEEIAHWAKDNGYDGVIIKGLREGSGDYTDDYIVFSSSQLKSADPVTYDDNGNVIPLSERFNTENADIRYSDRDTQSAYEILDENRRYEEEVDKFITDHKLMQKKMEIEKKYTKVTPNYEQLSSEASMLVNHVGSAYDKVVLAKELKSVYKGIQNGEDWNITMGKLMDIAEGVLKSADDTIDLTDSYADTVIKKYNESEAKWHLAIEMYNRLWNVAPVKNMSEKHRSDIAQLKAEHRRELDLLSLRKEWSAAKDAMKSKKKIEELRNKITETRKEVRRQTIEEGKQKLEEYKAKEERKKTIDSIIREAKKLKDKLETNSKEKHLIEPLKKPVLALLTSLDFSSNRTLGVNADGSEYKGKLKGEPTKAEQDLKDAFASLHDELTAIALKDAKITEEDMAMLIDLPTDFVSVVGEMKKTINHMVDYVGKKETFVLNRMSQTELDSLYRIVMTFSHMASHFDKTLSAENAKSITNLAHNTWSHCNGVGRVDKETSNFFDYDLALPINVFERIGAGEVFKLLQNGHDKLAYNSKVIIDYANEAYTNKEVKAWEKEVHEFDTPNGTLKLSTAQIMSLYCLQKREQARTHLLGQGISPDDIEVSKVKNKVMQLEVTTMNKALLNQIIGELTPRQREVADKLQHFLNNECSDWGNYVSMKRFGYEAFGEKNYFPIAVDGRMLPSEGADKGNSIYRLLNMSFTKNVKPNADKPIVISSIFDVFAHHTSEMAKYNALALPVLDTIKWYNHTEKERIKSDDKEERNAKPYSTKLAIEKAYGRNATHYVHQFLEDLNGTYSGGMTTADKWAKKMMSNAKIVAVGNNLRVALLQPTAYVRASLVINPKYLTKALGHKPQVKKAQETCGMAMWKSFGFYDTNITRGVASQIKHDDTLLDKAKEKSMWSASKLDELTWGMLYNACELEAKDKGLSGKALEEAVAERLREVIYRTQVVDSVMTRTQMMRSKSAWSQMYTSFMSEAMVSYNMFFNCYAQFTNDLRTSGKEVAIKKNGTKMLRASVCYIATTLAASLMGAIPDTMRDDDEEKEKHEIFLENFLENMIGDPLGMIPIVKDIVSGFQGYSASRMDAQYISSLYSAVKQLTNGEWNYKDINASLKAISQISGLPMSNQWRDFKAMWNSTIGEVYPSAKIK